MCSFIIFNCRIFLFWKILVLKKWNFRVQIWLVIENLLNFLKMDDFIAMQFPPIFFVDQARFQCSRVAAAALFFYLNRGLGKCNLKLRYGDMMINHFVCHQWFFSAIVHSSKNSLPLDLIYWMFVHCWKKDTASSINSFETFPHTVTRACFVQKKSNRNFKIRIFHIRSKPRVI